MRTTSNSLGARGVDGFAPVVGDGDGVSRAFPSTRTANFWLMALSSASGSMQSGRGRAFVASGVASPPYGPGAAAVGGVERNHDVVQE